MLSIYKYLKIKNNKKGGYIFLIYTTWKKKFVVGVK